MPTVQMLIGAAVAAILTLVMLVCGVEGKGPPRPHAFAPTVSMDRVVDNVYVGNWAASISEPTLKRHGIRAVLTLNYENRHNAGDEAMYKRLGIAHKTIAIQDSTDANIRQHFDECLNFIEAQAAKTGGLGTPTLIHCTAGISRSASIAVAYVIRKRRISADEALALVKSRRPIVWPNAAFRRQLDQFANGG